MPKHEEHGVALIIVLWMLVLLTVIANNLVFSSRTEIQISSHLASRAQAESIADAGVYMAIAQLANPAQVAGAAPDPARIRADGLMRAWSYEGADVQITIIDESGKLDLNTAPAPLFAGLFMAVGSEQAVAEALADAIVDWRDGDDLRQLHGAEKDDYLTAGRDTVPANMDFESIDEARQVLGMDDDLFRRVEPFLTVHSRQPGVNPAVAPREVLLALPNVTPEQVDHYIEQRRSLLEQGLPAPPFVGAQAAGRGVGAYSIQAVSVLGDNARFFRQAVVRLSGRPKEPVVFLAWRAPYTVSPVADPDAASDAALTDSDGQSR